MTKNEAQSKSRRFSFFVCFVVVGFVFVVGLGPKLKLAQSLLVSCFTYCGLLDGAIPKSKEKGLSQKFLTFMNEMKQFIIFSLS